MTPNRKISNAAPAQAQWVGNGTHAGAPLPLRFPFLHLALLTLGLTFGVVAPVSAQGTGPVAFDSTESALTGTDACNGGSAMRISAVDASTTDVTGSNDASSTGNG
jgi:hypothetical protein